MIGLAHAFGEGVAEGLGQGAGLLLIIGLGWLAVLHIKRTWLN